MRQCAVQLQNSCKTKLDANENAEVLVSSDEVSEAETKEEDESEDGFVIERKEPVASAHRAVWEQCCKQLGLEVGSW
jgi:hypothetical protein